ncbi:GTPase-activating protein S13 [Gaertneriomyces sp. JEL0708]|nr:GTPase-activating protein S13 [Gaertneriomyces sp. JEL0708]
MAAGAKVSFDTQHEDLIHDCQLDFYGRLLATCSSDRTIRIFETDGSSQTFVQSLEGHAGPVWQVSWAHPRFGLLLASCSHDKTVRVWKAPAPSGPWGCVWQHTLHTSSVNAVAFAPPEYGLLLLAGSSDGYVSVAAYDESSGEWNTSTLMAHSMGVNAISWAPSTVPGSLIEVTGSTPTSMVKRFTTAGCDNMIKIWREDPNQPNNFVEESQLEGHTDWVRDVAWAPNLGLPATYIASCGQDKQVFIWTADLKAATSNPPSWHKVALAYNSETGQFPDVVWKVSWSPTGNILAVSCGDNRVTLWTTDVETNKWKLVGGCEGEQGQMQAGSQNAQGRPQQAPEGQM